MRRVEDWILDRGGGLPEDRVGMGGEFHECALGLELGKLPPVVDGGEGLPQEQCQQPHADDGTDHTDEERKGKTRYEEFIIHCN